MRYQPHFQAYLDYMGKQDKSEVDIWQFQKWIAENRAVFKKKIDKKDHDGFNPNELKQFTAYLRGISKEGMRCQSQEYYPQTYARQSGCARIKRKKDMSASTH